MSGDRVVALAVALLCIVAMGVSATTLESSLSSDPDEVIDLDFENVPFGNDQAKKVKEEVKTNKDAPKEEVKDTSPQQQSQSQQEQEQPDGGDQGPGEEQSLWDQLLDLLLALLPYLLAVLLLLAAAVVARRYGSRLLALFMALFPQRHGGEDTTGTEWVADPRNEIERAWLAMTDRAGIARPRQMTTAECADAAVAAGLDRDAVSSLRSVFENVRYGTQPITDEDARRARESLRRMNLGGKV
ncbi:DUF4129 domain-containing protein [Halomarina rubra]|uniref:DUF4129 domain-containing protein n=1 Tax=Halomarina rubra TaxID=2071873 RepID=A0ABD6B0S9_9EURY|nr:DUF4129 domain-containing protein [Halomarina rubra]